MSFSTFLGQSHTNNKLAALVVYVLLLTAEPGLWLDKTNSDQFENFPLVFITILQVVFFGLIPLGILSTTISSSMKTKTNESVRGGINSFKMFITLCGVGLVYAIAYFLIGYRKRQEDEGGFFQCDIAYGTFNRLFFLPEEPYNFSTFNTDKFLDNVDSDIAHGNSPILNTHMWGTLGMLRITLLST